MAKKEKKSDNHILILLAGLFLILKFLFEGGIPSPSGDLLNFIVGLFTLIVILAFYGYFVFGAKGCNSTIRALAPSVLLLILYGHYSINYGNANVTKYLGAIANMAYLLIILCGFVYLFTKHKIIGTVFAWSSLVYAAFCFLSYIVLLIINLINGVEGAFNLQSCLSTMLLVGSLVILGITTRKIADHQQL